MQKHIQHNKDTSLEKYTSHFIERVLCEMELETEKNCNILTPNSSGYHSLFFPVLLGCSTGGLGGPASLGHGPHSSICSPTDLNFLSLGLYNNLTPTLLRASVTISHSIQPLNSQGRPWYPDIFDRMHLLFTQVHFFFWQLGQVGGQYTTDESKLMHSHHKNSWSCQQSPTKNEVFTYLKKV